MRELKPLKLIIQTPSYRVFKIEYVASNFEIKYKFVYEKKTTNTDGITEFMPVDKPCGEEIIQQMAEAS